MTLSYVSLSSTSNTSSLKNDASSPPGGPYIPIINSLCSLISYISHAILPMLSLSVPDSFGIISRPFLASMSIPPLLFGLSFVELCIFPVHKFFVLFRLSPLSLVSTRIIKSSFFRPNFFSVFSLFPCCPNPFTFNDRILICDILFLVLSLLSPLFCSMCF